MTSFYLDCIIKYMNALSLQPIVTSCTQNKYVLKSLLHFFALQAADVDFPPEDWHCISKEAHALVNSLLVVSVKRRLSAQQVLDHPWMVKMLPKSTPAEGFEDFEKSKKPLAGLAQVQGRMKVCACMTRRLGLEKGRGDGGDGGGGGCDRR